MDKVKASELIDWTTRDYVFTPIDGGIKGHLLAWGKPPRKGNCLILKSDDKEKPGAVYRVVKFIPGHIAADYDGFMVKVEFIPGSMIENDKKEE
jgi:hypothetical protein